MKTRNQRALFLHNEALFLRPFKSRQNPGDTSYHLPLIIIVKEVGTGSDTWRSEQKTQERAEKAREARRAKSAQGRIDGGTNVHGRPDLPDVTDRRQRSRNRSSSRRDRDTRERSARPSRTQVNEQEDRASSGEPPQTRESVSKGQTKGNASQRAKGSGKGRTPFIHITAAGGGRSGVA